MPGAGREVLRPGRPGRDHAAHGRHGPDRRQIAGHAAGPGHPEEVRPAVGAACSKATTPSTSARTCSTPTWCRTAAGGCADARRISAPSSSARRKPAQKILSGTFPDYIQQQFMEMLEYFGQSPLIVRSSSLLEDNYGNAFSGKYESVFLRQPGHAPGAPRRPSCSAVRTVYASAMSEEGLSYRQHHGLLDRDEQMALLVQRVSGELHGDLFFPHVAGRGLLVQSVRLERGHRSPGGHVAAGVWAGHARGGPHGRRLHPAGGAQRPAEAPGGQVRRSRASSPSAAWTCSTSRPTNCQPRLRTRGPVLPGRPAGPLRHARRSRAGDAPDGDQAERVLRRADLRADARRDRVRAGHARTAATRLQRAYDYPVDIEFTANFTPDGQFRINLLQCRPFQVKIGGEGSRVKVPEHDRAGAPASCRSRGPVVGHSLATVIDRLIYVVPSVYSQMGMSQRYSVARTISRLTHLEC
ncbi:MAG: PEP/pyruvate-binding domain-containing protein [Marinilabiliales bacterium]|nr:PEP/pyruvate-binding domain-containing protein [Marinilabiliales bacterium]